MIFFFPSHLKHWKNYHLFRNIWLLSVAGDLREGLKLARACSPFSCFFGLSPFSLLHCCKTAKFPMTALYLKTNTKPNPYKRISLTSGNNHLWMDLATWWLLSTIRVIWRIHNKAGKMVSNLCLTLIVVWVKCFNCKMAATCSLLFLWEHAPVIFQCRRR